MGFNLWWRTIRATGARWWLGTIGATAIVFLAVGGYAALAKAARAPAVAPGRTDPRSVSIPVAAAYARIGDMGVYLTGLGTVTALKTVTVRTQVDGQLVTVAFKEGQRVRATELLAQIDPRPFHVQLEQAEGQAAKDAATSRFWAIGPSLVETVFDGGRRRSVKEQAVANYDEAVAVYRQNTLTAFQDVEDNLAALRVLADEASQARAAVASANRSLELANYRYVGGVTTYLEVITAQTAALANQITAAEVLTRRMTASVLLMKALGGGWTTADLPHLG